MSKLNLNDKRICVSQQKQHHYLKDRDTFKRATIENLWGMAQDLVLADSTIK